MAEATPPVRSDVVDPAAAARVARVRAVIDNILDQTLPKLPMTARPSFNTGLLTKCTVRGRLRRAMRPEAPSPRGMPLRRAPGALR